MLHEQRQSEQNEQSGLMSKFTAQQKADLRRYVKAVRSSLIRYEAWPRDARAWARRDRIEALLTEIETLQVGATEDDPAHFIRLTEELEEWMERESTFVRDYPILEIPEAWIRREPSPSVMRQIKKVWRGAAGIPSRPTKRRRPATRKKKP